MKLKTIQGYKKEKELEKKTSNIDQIFYIDRDRQKHYIKIINNVEFTSRYACLKDSKLKMTLQTKKNMEIVQRTM